MTADPQYQYGTCRDLRHRWSRKVTLSLGGSVLRRTTKCTDCSTERVERFQVRGMKIVRALGSSYHYPNGYTIPGGHVPAMEFRSAALENALRTGVVTMEES